MLFLLKFRISESSHPVGFTGDCIINESPHTEKAEKPWTGKSTGALIGSRKLLRSFGTYWPNENREMQQETSTKLSLLIRHEFGTKVEVMGKTLAEKHGNTYPYRCYSRDSIRTPTDHDCQLDKNCDSRDAILVMPKDLPLLDLDLQNEKCSL